ncbi:ABC transporter ATP-binding protein [Marinicrinis sediminis]|uniref:ABC transporter ATP-binding protein n=2 Tax=Marinicrinis sediminis TaxID=1652465 RepID=A0ABW5R9J5_9BACL
MLSIATLGARDHKVLMRATKVSKVYGSGQRLHYGVKETDLNIYAGDFTVIMGPSGSGKSTLLHLLSGLDRVTTGELYFKGQRIDQRSEKELGQFRSRKMGCVYQAFHLVPDLTILENILFPAYIAGMRKEAAEKKAHACMVELGIIGLQHRYPSQVSGGQQQRTAIARALINSPEILFADEPTGALSQEQGTRILDIFTDLNQQGQSIVMVTHDAKAACRANRLLVVKDGMVDQIVGLGKYEANEQQKREADILSILASSSQKRCT